MFFHKPLQAWGTLDESCTDEEAASLILKNCPQNPLEGGPAVSSKHVLHLKPTEYSEIHIAKQMYKIWTSIQNRDSKWTTNVEMLWAKSIL